MEINRRFVSIWISVAALLVSLTTLYLNYGKAVELDLAVSRDIYISNTRGGIPDVNLSFTLWAAGPVARAITVDAAEVVLTDTETGISHALVSNPGGEVFPAIIKGGDIVTHRLLFSVNDYIQVRIERYDSWCDELIAVLPDKSELIESIRNQLKSEYVPVGAEEETEGASEDVDMGRNLAMLLADDDVEDGEQLDEDVSSLLREAPVEQLRRLVFFTSGNYEMQVTILGPFGEILATQNSSFSIDNVVSQTLLYRFNSNVRVRTERNTSS